MGQKILVVEDNELNLKLFCDLLRAHGYEAEPVRDGRDALDRARAFGPDLVVMDIQMPHVSGLELIEQMKADAELRPTPIMAVTAYAAKGDEERIRDAGAEGYVSKPISVLRFVEAVAGLLTVAAERAAGEAQGDDGEAPAGIEAEEPASSSARHSGESGNPEGSGEAAPTLDDEGEAEEDAETPDPSPTRHSRESGNPDGSGEGKEEEKLDPGSSPG